jgi:glycosyltransferase involved in cell wall biosynthesis
MKFLVFATDVLPIPGLPTTGTALRTHGFVQGLRMHGHKVEVSVPREALASVSRQQDLTSLSPEARDELGRLKDTAFDFRNQASLVHGLQPDVVFCGHWPAATFHTRIRQPLVIDLAGPHLLERHYQGEPDHEGAVLGKLRAVSNADYFVVSGAKQRLYFLSFLLRARVAQPEKRTITIPMPLSPELPDHHPSSPDDDFPRFVFAGVFLPWQDPTLGLERTAATLAERQRGTLKLIGGPHPSYEIQHGIYANLFARLSRFPFVQRLPMLPYDRFLAELTTADVALDLMRWNLERELAMTIRSTTYLWSGLPVIYNDYADLADLIREYDAGWTVSPADPEALARVLAEVFDGPESVARKGSNARRLARDVFSWDRAVVPLLEAIGAHERGPLTEVDVAVAIPQNASLTVTADCGIEQRFLSRIDGLCRVECCLALHGRTHLRPITAALYRHDTDGDGRRGRRELLVRKTVAGDSLKDNEWLSLDVGPIPDSAGQVFALTLESDARREEESVSPWAVDARMFPLLDLYQGGRLVRETSLCFRTTSSRRPS